MMEEPFVAPRNRRSDWEHCLLDVYVEVVGASGTHSRMLLTGQPLKTWPQTQKMRDSRLSGWRRFM